MCSSPRAISPRLDSLQYIGVFPVLGGPNVSTTPQVQSHECQLGGNQLFSSSEGYTLAGNGHTVGLVLISQLSKTMAWCHHNTRLAMLYPTTDVPMMAHDDGTDKPQGK